MDILSKFTLPHFSCNTRFIHSTLNFSCSITLNGNITQKKFKDLIDDYRIYLPSLQNTKLPDTNCPDMVVQGICTAADDILISAYCNPGSRRKPVHTSVIYVIHKQSGEFIKTLTLGYKAHVGGIAYDGTYLWVCSGRNPDSTTAAKYPGTVTAYTFSACADLILANPNSEYVNISPAKKGTFPVEVTSSFCTCYGGKLWVGNFVDSSSEFEKGKVIGYPIKKYGTSLLLENNSSSKISFSTLNRVQGLSFIMYEGYLYTFLTRSAGRNRTKQSYISELHINRNKSYHDIKISNNVYYKKITLPPMVEGITSDNSAICFIFESAANIYLNGTDKKGKSEYPVNRVCRIGTHNLLE